MTESAKSTKSVLASAPGKELTPHLVRFGQELTMALACRVRSDQWSPDATCGKARLLDMAVSPLSWAMLGGVGLFAARYFSLSPGIIMMVSLLLFFAFGGKRQPGGAEQFTPVFSSSVVAGLRSGVASVQGRRQYMEDMYQTVAFDAHEQPAAARIGLTHFFAVFDGHGGKRAAAWAHQHLVANLMRELSQDASPSTGASADACAESLDSAAVDAFHKTDGGERPWPRLGCPRLEPPRASSASPRCAASPLALQTSCGTRPREAFPTAPRRSRA